MIKVLKEEVIITRKDGNRFKLVPINKKAKNHLLILRG
jgi:antitoxin (DNA-binding transcriptional repressor) of toxin-antitoxin stability system